MIVLDIVSKQLAYYCLTDYKVTLIPGVLYLSKIVKTLPFADATIVNKPFVYASDTDISDSFLISFVYPILLIYSLLIKKRRSYHFVKYLILLLLYYIYLWAIYSGLLKINSELILTHQYSSVIAVLINYIVIPILLLFLFENGYIKLILSFLIAANLGNVLSFFYPPYVVVDFLYFPSTNITYDIADIYLMIKNLLILLTPILMVTHYLKLQKKKQ